VSKDQYSNIIKVFVRAEATWLGSLATLLVILRCLQAKLQQLLLTAA